MNQCPTCGTPPQTATGECVCGAVSAPKPPGPKPKSPHGAGKHVGVRLSPDLHSWLASQPGTQRETVEAGLRLLMQLGGLVPSEQWTDAEVIAEVARRGLFTPKPPEGGNHE